LYDPLLIPLEKVSMIPEEVLKLQPHSLEEWAKSHHTALAMVFTDVVLSTRIAQKRGDRKWLGDVGDHFTKGRKLCWERGGYVVKVIGDSMLCVFRSAPAAFRFATKFYLDTGSPLILIRAGIHAGWVHVVGDDIYGLNVNLAARVQSAIRYDGITMSEAALSECVKESGSDFRRQFMDDRSLLKDFANTKYQRLKSTGDYAARSERVRVRISTLLDVDGSKLFVSSLTAPETENSKTRSSEAD
jgi:class 3 adenylate cyclase